MKQQVNLYQPILRRERKVFGAQAMLMSVLVAVAGLALLSGVLAWRLDLRQTDVVALERQAEALRARVARLEQQYPVPRKDPTLVAAVERLQKEVAGKRRFLEHFTELETGAGLAPYLAALARQPVEGLWLTGLSVGPEGVDLHGGATDPALVPRLIERLGQEPVFIGREFRGLQLRRRAEGVVEFELRSREEQQ